MRHGRSQGQIFTEVNILITFPLGNVVNCPVVYEDLTSYPYLIVAGGISGG